MENVVKYVKQNFLSTRDFKVLEEAQESVLRWLVRRGNGKISQATKRIPADVIEEERKHLRPVRNSIYLKESILGREERIADENGRISVNASQYSLPEGYKNKTVEIYTTDTMLFVFDRYTGEQIAEHELSLIPGKIITKREHRRKNGKTTQEMKEEMLKKFPLERWLDFAEANFKAYSRYTRDQCLEAQRRFGREVDSQCLDRALEFCLEHKTYSIANLHDTYMYFKSVSETKEDDILTKIEPQLKEIVRYRSGIRVAKRDLSVYKSFISTIMGILL